MNEPKTLSDMLALGESTFAAALADRQHAARYVTFCTVTPDGPAARTVMLRAWEAGVALVQTDGASHKVAELAADPRVALVMWDPGADVQLRLNGRARVDTGATEDWARMPAPARLNYGGAPTPGTVMETAEEYVPGSDAARFVVVACEITRWEVLHLGVNMHRRALFAREDGTWQGQWIAP